MVFFCLSSTFRGTPWLTAKREMHQVEDRVIVPAPIEEVWNFFSNPENLKELTPPEMKMRMVSRVPAEMYEGLILRYRVAPLMGINLPWASEITVIEPQRYFVDRMLEGPFAQWHHEHHFKAVKEGVEMLDRVHYKVPLGLLGELFHPLLVKNNVKQLFQYRRKQIEAKFGKP